MKKLTIFGLVFMLLFSLSVMADSNLTFPALTSFNFNIIQNHSQNSSMIFSTIQNSSLGNCTIVSNNVIWFFPNSSISGSGSCLINVNDQIGNQTNVTLSITTHTLSDLGGGGAIGGGSGGTCEPIIIEEIIQVIDFQTIAGVTTETFLGDKITLIKEAKGIEIQTENLNDRYDLLVIAGSEINKRFTITNIGEEKLSLKISCLGDFCENVILDARSSVLDIGEKDTITLSIFIPEDVEKDDVFGYSIIVEDVQDSSFKASLPVKITISPLLGRISEVFSIDKMFVKGFDLTDDFTIPNFALMILLTTLTFITLSLAFTVSGKSLFFNILRYVGTVLSIIIFLLVI